MPATAVVTGRLARDPEFRDAGSTRLAILTVPTDKGFGERKVTTWWTIQVWGKAAERIENAIAQHGMYQKGDNITASGTPSLRTYQKNDGTQGTSMELDASSVDPIFPPKQDRQTSYASDDYSESVPF